MAGPRPPAGRGVAGTTTVLGLLGFVLSAAGSWQPSFWGDEAASVMSAERSVPSLFQMLGHIDAVHGTYYLFLHYWIGLFGASEFSTRLPSAIAIGVATAGTVALARALVNTRVAILAGLVFAVLPRVTYMGAEARSTAFATATAVWAAVLLVNILRRQRDDGRVPVALWAGYAVITAAGAYLFLYTVLLIPVHALLVLLSRRKDAAPGTDRRAGHGSGLTALWPWAAAVAGSLVLATPILYWGLREQDQISFIARRPQVSLLEAAVNQWFGNPALAATAWFLVVLAAVAAFAFQHGQVNGQRSTWRVLVVALAWMLFPSVVLYLGNQLVTPMYALRYLSICTPAVALAMAIGIASIRLRWLQVTAVVLVVGLAVPSYLAQRGPYGKDDGSDLRQAAAVVEAGAHPGDAVVFDESVRPSWKPRLALHLYPTAFQGLRDVTLKRQYTERAGLWDSTIPLEEATTRLTNTGTVWVLQFRGSQVSTTGTTVQTLEAAGFSVVHSTTVNRTVVIEMTR